MLINNQLCDPQMTNNHNQTSLHLVCKGARYGFSQTTLFLCKHGCNVHQLDDHGHSPASYAFENEVSLLKEMIANGYCNPTKDVQSVQKLTDYCHIMGSYETMTIQLPLPHLAVYRLGYESDEIMDFLLSQQDFSPIVFDSFENTFFHLKSFSYQLSNRFLAISNRDYLNKQNKEGNTPLHLACATGNKRMMEFLIESEKCSESLSKKNMDGYTPLQYAQDRDMINYLVLNGADPKDIVGSTSIIQMFEILKGKHPLNPTVTVLVLGNSMAGKTTLIKSLTKAYSWEHTKQPSIGQTKDVEFLEGKSGPTAGVEISEYKVLETNEVRILFYDFAGHPEFESTHSILLQNLLTSSEPHAFLFLLVVDITQRDKLTQLSYWARFIQNCESSFAIGKSEMIVIGSHVDELSKEEIIHKAIKSSINKTLKSISFESIENPILLDCRQPKLFELQKVQTLLIESTKKVKEHTNLDIRSHLIFAYLYEHFPNEPVRFSVLQESFKEKKVTGVKINELSFTRRTIIDLLKVMHDRQHILLIGLQPNSPEADFWILTAIARSLMFKNVNGVLFASEEDFDRNIKIRSNVGVLPSSVLKEEFPDIEYDLLQQFLEYSELCKKITDTEILHLLEDRIIESDSKELEEEMECEYSSDKIELLNVAQGTRVNSNDQHNECVEYFFFPGLVKGTRDSHIWESNEGYSYAAGWSLQCTENSFFNAIFLQVLLLRLVFQFAVSETKLHRRCIIWKNGVFWSAEGVEMLLEVVNQNQVVNVLVRCFEDSELDAVRLRSAILKEVFKVKEKHCPKTKVIEYIICDPHFNDCGSLSESVQMVHMREIISAIFNGSSYVQDTSFQYHVINKSLLCFEPYVGIGDELLTLLFDIDKANETVADDFVSRITDLQKRAFAQEHHTNFMMQQVKNPIVYRDLQILFDKYSIFHGRNPKVGI
jgi:ankyrin repeat protein